MCSYAWLPCPLEEGMEEGGRGRERQARHRPRHPEARRCGWHAPRCLRLHGWPLRRAAAQASGRDGGPEAVQGHLLRGYDWPVSACPLPESLRREALPGYAFGTIGCGITPMWLLST